MKKLTVILAFLNEGNELDKTLESLNMDPNFKEKCECILVNDGSTDKYDYEAVAKKYDAFYIHHAVQMGSSYSKNEGVEFARTEYFLILDAHMRVLTDNWVDKLIDALKQDHNAIYCCGCRSLEWREDDVYMNDLLGLCAMVSFKKDEVFHLDWIVKDRIPDCPDILQVPALLGGSYCGHVNYWMKLHGLQHQILFGHEEQMMSLKSWVAGNGVKCLTHIEFAHKFRQGVRKYPGWGATFNLMISVYLVVPDDLFAATLKFWESHTVTFADAYKRFKECLPELEKEKEYLKSISHRDYASFEQFNNEFKNNYINGSKKVQSRNK